MYKLAIIGSGPAGLKVAYESIRYGLKNVCLIEKETLGGVCLNRGCIPTKFFVNFLYAVKTANYYQDLIKKESIDFPLLVKKREQVIANIRKGAQDYLTNRGVELFFGSAELIDTHTVQIGSRRVSSDAIVIATGSEAATLDFLPREKTFSPEAFITRVEKLPRSVLIVGGGTVGVEYAALLNLFGCSVTLVEKETRILPFLDKELSARMAALLKRSGITVKVGSQVHKEDAHGYEAIIEAIGRIPSRSVLKQCVLETTQKGFLKVDDYMRTSADTIYACGDIAGRNMYAYTAEYEARCVARTLAGTACRVEKLLYPLCIFSVPSVAAVGLSEEEAIAQHKNVVVKKLFLLEQSAAHALTDTEGFIKVLLDKDTDALIGAGIVSKYAPELIHLFYLALAERIPVSSLKKLIIAHPTIAEALVKVLD